MDISAHRCMLNRGDGVLFSCVVGTPSPFPRGMMKIARAGSRFVQRDFGSNSSIESANGNCGLFSFACGCGAVLSFLINFQRLSYRVVRVR